MGSGECVRVRVKENFDYSDNNLFLRFSSYISMPLVILSGLLVDVKIARENSMVRRR